MEKSNVTPFLEGMVLETQYGLAGFGEHTITLHAIQTKTGQELWATAWRNSKLLHFAEVNWLRGHILIQPINRKLDDVVKKIDGELFAQMMDSSFAEALAAIRKRDIYEMSKAVMTTYVVQQLLGLQDLKHLGEIGRRYTLNCDEHGMCKALYLFENEVPANLRVSQSRVL